MENVHGCVERKYLTLRRRLDELGYHQPLSSEALLLVERLLGDLLHTTDRLSHYKSQWQKTQQEYGDFKQETGPFIADYEKLSQECSFLKSKFLLQDENHEKDQQKLREQLHTLKNANAKLQFLNSECMSKVRNLEKGISERNHRIIQLQNENLQAFIVTTGITKGEKCKRQPKLEIDHPIPIKSKWKDGYLSKVSQVKDPCVVNMMSVADARIESLTKELEDMKFKNEILQEKNRSLRSEILDQEKEIHCVKQKNAKCCQKHADNSEQATRCKKVITHPNMANEITSLEKINKDLKAQLKEALDKQHEAMEQAVKLADRNQDLEKELHDIDHMALAVESECKLSLKENSERVSKIQDRLESSLVRIHDLEQEILELKHMNSDLKQQLDNKNKGRRTSQNNAEVVLEEKKKEVGKLNENVQDLTQKVEHLTHTIRSQKQRILELESKLLENAGSWKKNKRQLSPVRNKEHQEWTGVSATELHGTNRSADKVRVTFTDAHTSPEHDLSWNKLVEITSCSCCQNSTGEYFDEYTSVDISLEVNADAVEEYYQNSDSSSKSERDQTKLGDISEELFTARNDVRRLEEELSALRRQLQVETELHENEKTKLEESITQAEERLRKLQSEQRELSSGHGSLRAIVHRHESTISRLEESLKSSQSDYQKEKNLNNQLKTLQEQTERALVDAQTKLSQLASEQNLLQGRMKGSEENSLKVNKEANMLKAELNKLRDSLVQLDQDKDGLMIKIDEKTERIAGLEGELKGKTSRISQLEHTIAEMKKKFDVTINDSVVRDHERRKLQLEIDRLQQELSACKTHKENVIRENRRIQDDLASVTNDCRISHRELEESRREVEDLKLQLQGYVDEVRRIEDLLAHKEEERNDLLDQFRSLSAEASVLESTNHSLESETTDARMQLRMTNERVVDLERQLDDAHSLIRGYEQQISTLTRQVATFEMQFRTMEEQRIRLEVDLAASRELCRKLDGQKEQLMERISNSSSDKTSMEKEASKLRKDFEKLHSTIESNNERVSALESKLLRKEKECLEEQMTNEELKQEIERLQENIFSLEKKLEKEMAEVHKYQKKALEYGCQLGQTRKEADEPFRYGKRSSYRASTLPPQTRFSVKTKQDSSVSTRVSKTSIQTYSKPSSLRIKSVHGSSAGCITPLVWTPPNSAACSSLTVMHNLPNVHVEHESLPSTKVHFSHDKHKEKLLNSSSNANDSDGQKISKGSDTFRVQDDQRPHTSNAVKNLSAPSQLRWHGILPSGSEVSVAVDEKEDEEDLLIRLDSPTNSYFSG